MFCPVCGVEYRPGFTVCSDCQVALVHEPPRQASASPSTNDDAGEKSFTLVWSGSDGRVHAEICEALERRGIPLRSLDTDDYLFNLTMRPDHQVYVPADFVDSAREAIKQVDAIEESVNPSESDVLEIPAEEGPEEGDYEDLEKRRESQAFDLQDASVKIWSGQDADLAAMIASSLRENGIPYRSDPGLPAPEVRELQNASDEMSFSNAPGSSYRGHQALLHPTTILVFPEDEKRAKAIIREILNAAPPE